jgi:glycolate oxidase FAD binding subunit
MTAMTPQPRPATDVLHHLLSICGAGFARFAGAADDVAGVPARFVAIPGTVEAVTAVLRLAADADLAVVARGAGTKLDWGAAPPRVDLMLDTGRLAGVWHRPAGDFVAEVGAGTPLRAAQALLGRAGQRLPLDPPSRGATVGGVVAADEAGPLRHRYGTPCDQLVGVSYVDAAGALHHASWGAHEAPAPDLRRLLCGSYGGLGVLVSATLRVQPVPARRLWVRRTFWTALEMHDLVREALAISLTPAAVEVDLRGSPGAGRLAVLLEGGVAAVVDRAQRLARLLVGDAQVTISAPVWWGRYPFGPGDVALRLELPADELHSAVYALRDAAGGPIPVRAAAGLGVAYAALSGSLPVARVAGILAGVRQVLLARGGTCVVLAAPPAVRRSVDLWGDRTDLPLLRRVKHRFDPAHRLAPGRFTGGL